MRSGVAPASNSKLMHYFGDIQLICWRSTGEMNQSLSKTDSNEGLLKYLPEIIFRQVQHLRKISCHLAGLFSGMARPGCFMLWKLHFLKRHHAADPPLVLAAIGGAALGG